MASLATMPTDNPSADLFIHIIFLNGHYVISNAAMPTGVLLDPLQQKVPSGTTIINLSLTHKTTHFIRLDTILRPPPPPLLLILLSPPPFYIWYHSSPNYHFLIS
jgi:hypothetical protein